MKVFHGYVTILIVAHLRSCAGLDSRSHRPFSNLKALRGGRESENAIGSEQHGDLRVSTAVLNLVADLCPHGMLPLAYGMRLGTGGGLATCMLLLFGAGSTYSLVSIGRACHVTDSRSFQELWMKLVDEKTAWIVDGLVAFLCFGCCIFYSAFLGDLFSALASAANLPKWCSIRSIVLTTLGLVPLLPLCLLRNLSALQYSSFAGVVAIFYTVYFVFRRYIDQSYQLNGFYHAAMPEKLQPILDTSRRLFYVSPGSIFFMNMACVAFLCHYNGPKYYMELKERTPKNFAIACVLGFGISAMVFTTIMYAGYRTFGQNAQALLLNNYHRTDDMLATFARLATGCAILSGYPLMFAGYKNSLFTLFPSIPKAPSSVASLALITVIAFFCTEEEVGFVINLVGSLLGSLVVYVVPSVMNLRLLVKHQEYPVKVKLHRFEVLVNHFCIIAGVLFAIIGTISTLYDQFSS